MERPRRRAHLALACLLLAPIVAACGSTKTTTQTVTVTTRTAVTETASATTPTATTPAPATTDTTTISSVPNGVKPTPSSRCHTSQLSAHLVEGSPGAGQRYATLLLSNRNPKPCTLYGYPGAQLIGASGRPIQTNIVRDHSRSAQSHAIAFGQQARSEWHWTAVAGGDEPATGACEPTARTIDVTPPDETTSLEIPWPFDAVCGHGRIDVSPIAIVTGT